MSMVDFHWFPQGDDHSMEMSPVLSHNRSEVSGTENTQLIVEASEGIP